MRKYIELPLKLFLITFILGLILGVTYMYTKEPIAEQRAAQLRASRQEAFPGAEFEEMPMEEWQNFISADGAQIKEVFIATRQGEFSGYVVSVISKGYGGDMEIIVGVGADKHIMGLVVADHNETAGLGANAAKDYFTDQFDGKLTPVLSKDEPNSDQAIDALTGATITSRAVTEGVDAVVELIENLMEVNANE
jgi:electron transport complex protein RnfG